MTIRVPPDATELTDRRKTHSKTWLRDDGKRVVVTSALPTHWNDNGTIRDIDFTPTRQGNQLQVRGPVDIDIARNFVGFTYTAPTGTFTARLAGANGIPVFYQVLNSMKAGFLWENVFPDVDVRILLLPRLTQGRATVQVMSHTVIKTPAAQHSFDWDISGTLEPRPPVLESALGESYPEFVTGRRVGNVFTIAVDAAAADFVEADYPLVIH